MREDPGDTLLERRWERQRRQGRTVLWWSFAAAVAIHAAVLWYGPWLRPDPVTAAGTELEGGGGLPDFSGSPVRVFFGPPTIARDDGNLFPEPADRVLSAERRVTLVGCGQGPSLEGEGASGEVRLLVNDRGRIDSVFVTQTTGSPCWDRAMASIASDLRYHWLPNERFAAPVSLFQPVALSLAGY